MKPSSLLMSSLTLLLFLLQANSHSYLDDFLNCLPNHSNPSIPISPAIYTSTNALFSSLLLTRIQNRRYSTPKTPKPLAIITAKHESHVQATVLCAKFHGLQIRIRSGGHDYEGLSYVSGVPFVILDMFNLNSIDINIASETASVQAGATIGSLYYNIAKKSNIHAFPCGVGITMGAGGHFSGGGYGNLMRKYGLSVDNIIDAQIVDVNGRILDRKSMGEDLFWAIRGGGGASFGVILSWKIKLVRVPPKVTVFNVKRLVEQGATDVLYKWQLIAHELDQNLFLRAMPLVVNGTQKGTKTIEVSFIGQFLGRTHKLLNLMKMSFPELGLQKSDCIEMPWVNTTLFWNYYPIETPIEVLLQKHGPPETFFKSKSDYVKNPIPKAAIESIWQIMIKGENVFMQWNPYGGIMEQILPSATPFPHRAGYLFKIQYYTSWLEPQATESSLNFSRSFYEFMKPYVSSSPRETFLNYRDLDIGANPSNMTSIIRAKTYGMDYYKENFERLMLVKTRVDPDNFFKHEQSIPPRHY